jgi:Na+-transporting NADH:ubiquinone oxidoreductase subunit NqrB
MITHATQILILIATANIKIVLAQFPVGQTMQELTVSLFAEQELQQLLIIATLLLLLLLLQLQFKQ